jgi:hypothetical protein
MLRINFFHVKNETPYLVRISGVCVDARDIKRGMSIRSTPEKEKNISKMNF